ncbi:DUF1425 domain-containing protein [Facilibium subflavum]|uniref:DUF1425 domain-containing protein n=1 Tax=Facilibium subflavum TaxID=2219058 RepID=UPI0013C31157|nr:YcfL family protein [Facilibium subflavum]
MRIKPIIYVSALSGVIFLSGCASRCITVPANATDSQRFGSGFGQLTASQPSVHRVDNGNIQGQISVKNNKSANQNFQYQIQWFDKTGVAVGQPQPWTPVQVYGDLQKTITFTAPMPNATSYRISFCRAE